MNELNKDLENTNEIVDRDFESEIEKIIASESSDQEKRELLDDYHESDLADVVEKLSEDERLKLYEILGNEKTAEIFTYLENVDEFIDELEYHQAADIIQEMDADDAVDVLEELDDEDKINIIDLIDDNEIKQDIHLIESYDEDMIGSKMTTNFISIPYGVTVPEAMKLLVKEAADNDNVSTIYVVKEKDEFYGSIDLRDLIIARKDTSLDDIIKTSYPTLFTTQKVDEVIKDIAEYALDSIPVLNNNNQLVGAITYEDVIEAVDQDLTEDYAKLGGLSSEDELNTNVFKSFGKRAPWLIVLMVLGLLVSMVTSTFDAVIAALPAIVFFQALVLDTAGNVGTQSLAVTIRAISQEENSGKLFAKTIWKEIRVGFVNGIILSIISFCVVLLFLFIRKQEIVQGAGYSFVDTIKSSGCVAVAVIISMTVSAFTGTAIPIVLTKLRVDPAVASGPFITTINDVLAIAIYYGTAFLLFRQMI